MSAAPGPEQAVIRVVAAVIADAQGRVLLVRKRGSAIFQQPGGKPDPQDADELATLARELEEELGCTMLREDAQWLGRCAAAAANEAGWRVEASVYRVAVSGECRACAEIAELRWVDPRALPPDLAVAPLSRDEILPRL